MGTLHDKLVKIKSTKDRIKQAIEEKGVYVDEADAFSTYPDRISAIETGGGGSDDFQIKLAYSVDENGKASGKATALEISGIKDYGLDQNSSPFSLYSARSGLSSDGGCTPLYANPNIKTFTMPEVEYVSGNYAFYQTAYNSGLEEVIMPKLREIRGDYAFYYAFRNCASLKNIRFPKLELAGAQCFLYCFNGCSSLENVNLPELRDTYYASFEYAFYQDANLKTALFPKLELVASGYTFYNAFNGCTKLSTIDFSNARSAGGDYCFKSAFQGCKALTEARFPEMAIDSGNTFMLQNMFSDCTLLETVELPKVKSVTGERDLSYIFSACVALKDNPLTGLERIGGTYGAEYAFSNCHALTDVAFPELKYVNGSYGCYRLFNNCQGLTKITFPKLEQINSSYVFQNAFITCSALKDAYFPALTTDFFKNGSSSYTNVFNAMLSGVTGCTVHFPVDLRHVIDTWADTVAGFGGTDTKVVFDLNGANITFNVTAEGEPTIYIDGELVENNLIHLTPGSKEWVAYSGNSFKTGITEELERGQDITIDVDIVTNERTITFNPGVVGMTVGVNVAGKDILAVDNEDGTYTIKTTSAPMALRYFAMGLDDYADYTGAFEYTGEDATVNITLTPAIVQDYTRPNLTANGTLGGSDTAVQASTEYSTAYAIWKAFDGTVTSTYWRSTAYDDNRYVTYYSPNPLKITSTTMNYRGSTSYSITALKVEGSQDGNSWETIYTWTGAIAASLTFDMSSNSKFYKYYKFNMTPRSTTSSTYIDEMTFVAKEKIVAE